MVSIAPTHNLNTYVVINISNIILYDNNISVYPNNLGNIPKANNIKIDVSMN